MCVPGKFCDLVSQYANSHKKVDHHLEFGPGSTFYGKKSPKDTKHYYTPNIVTTPLFENFLSIMELVNKHETEYEQNITNRGQIGLVKN